MIGFLDYEKIIRDKYPILIDSYVDQYGEEYRKEITDRLEKVKYGFFVTPDSLRKYVIFETKFDQIMVVLATLEEIGIDISNFTIDLQKKCGITSDNHDLSQEAGNLLAYLLNPEEKKSIDKLISKYPLILDILNEKKQKYLGNYQFLLDYASLLDEKVQFLSNQYYNEIFSNLSYMLTSEDEEYLAKNKGKDIDWKNLTSYELWFNHSDNHFIIDSSIKYFDSFYTSILLNSTDLSLKEQIIKKRLIYLKSIDCDVSMYFPNTNDINSYCCDWYHLPKLSKILPDHSLIQGAIDLETYYNDKYEHDLVRLYCINNFQIEDSDYVHTFINDSSAACFFTRHGSKPEYIVWLKPLSFNPLFDVTIDHELRHAIETYVISGNSEKSGINFFTSFSLFNNQIFTNYNESVVEKLSLESTLSRFAKGQFILSNKYSKLFLNTWQSSYSQNIERLNIIFEPFRKQLIAAQKSINPNAIFSIFSQPTLEEINSLITNNSPSSILRLQQIRDELLSQKVKVKELN